MIVQSITLRLDNAELVENLREQKAVAEQANTDKSRFLAAASHDLRQPMHAIGLLVEAMEHRLQGQQADLFCTLNKSVHNLKDLFDALLDISRLDAGVVDVSKHHFSLTELINELIPGYKQRAKLKDLDFNIEQPADSVVFSDPILLRRILENLISNAIRYTDSGEISIRINHQGGNVLLSIKDTGRGISSEDQSKVFTEFFQVDNPERDRTKGLGLGLSIVHRLAVLLEIKLELSSTLAAGTCFRFFLPAGQEDKIFVSTAASPAHLPEVEATILIIDDEQDVLVAMQAMLTGWGYKIYTAEDLDGALSVLNKLPTTVDLVISDYRLREHKTGSEVISALRTHVGKTIPALIITGDTEAARIQKAQSSGIQLLHKPVRPAQLRLAILHCIGNRHLNTIQD
jgi:CheY-like chemotaxis protein/nitrogen-specific signal transduction histidine kinase